MTVRDVRGTNSRAAAGNSLQLQRSVFAAADLRQSERGVSDCLVQEVNQFEECKIKI